MIATIIWFAVAVVSAYTWGYAAAMIRVLEAQIDALKELMEAWHEGVPSPEQVRAIYEAHLDDATTPPLDRLAALWNRRSRAKA